MIKNRIRIINGIAIIYINSPKYGLKVTFINADKLYLLEDWSRVTIGYYPNVKGFYAIVGRGAKEQERLHRIVSSCPRNMMIDHKDHNTLNNLNSNLSVGTNFNNQQNRIKDDESSDIVGISKCTKHRGTHLEKNYWKAHIQINGKLIFGKHRPYTEDGLLLAIGDRRKLEENIFIGD